MICVPWVVEQYVDGNAAEFLKLLDLHFTYYAHVFLASIDVIFDTLGFRSQDIISGNCLWWTIVTESRSWLITSLYYFVCGKVDKSLSINDFSIGTHFSVLLANFETQLNYADCDFTSTHCRSLIVLRIVPAFFFKPHSSWISSRYWKIISLSILRFSTFSRFTNNQILSCTWNLK